MFKMTTTNLKNFPVKSTPQKYERWMKQFKKELIERRDRAIQLRDGEDKERDIDRGFQMGRIWAINGILNET